MKILVSIFLSAWLAHTGFAQLSPEQEHQVDSLKKVVKAATHDSTIVRAWMAWDNIIYMADPEFDLILNQRIDSLCQSNLQKDLNAEERAFFREAKADTYHNLGILYYIRGEVDKAVEFYNKSLKDRKEIGDKNGLAMTYVNLGIIYKNKGDFKKAIELYNEGLAIRKEIGDKKGMASAYHNIGSVYYNQGNIEKAIEFFNKSLKTRGKDGDKRGMADTNYNLGIIHYTQGNVKKAIEFYTTSLKIREEIGDKRGVAMSYVNLGSLYKDQGNVEKAIEFFNKSLDMRQEIGDKRGMAESYNNLGILNEELGNFEEAIEFHQKSLKLVQELDDKLGIADSYNNLGSVYKSWGDMEKAIELYEKSLKIREEVGEKRGVAMSYSNLGSIFYELGDFKKAVDYSSRSLKLSKELGMVKDVKNSALYLWKSYKAANRFKESLETYELYIAMRDSIESEENQKALIRQEYKYQYEKQAAADSVKNAEAQKVKDAEILAQKAVNDRNEIKLKQGELEKKRQNQRTWFLGGILALAVLFAIFIFNRFMITKKQRDIIEEQKSMVEFQKAVVEEQKAKVDEAYEQLEEKNTEILDSINYAKRIQTAILPPNKLVKQYLADSFILYKPKDIVAGDFYWMEPQKDRVLFAAADCTGHGVPGAMVSVVCNNGLNRATREFGLTDPGQILDKAREIVIAEFEKSEEEVKDGMDIALCSLQGNMLQYAGANNPLWIIRKDSSEVEEIKANKQPIGKYADPKPYTTHSVELQKGDTIYIFSDGYADQFGGEKGKKFKAANFKRLLLSIQSETIERQKELIDKAFEDWKDAGGQPIEQLDDVCVIGLRV